MAFVSRAERKPYQATASSSSLGPGAYDIEVKPPQIHGFAPFTSTTERTFQNIINSATPGPGAYQPSGGPSASYSTEQWALSKPSRAFASQCQRFQHPTASGTPGPGSYNLANSMQKQLRAQPQGATLTKGWQQFQSAPSIPAANQVFGYETAPSGQLIMQKNPEKVFSGDKGDSVGPGHYNVEFSSPQKGSTWHKSTVQRTLQHGTNSSPALGPGSYSDPKMNIGPLYKFKPSAVFCSTSKRTSFVPPAGKPAETDSSGEEEEDAVPGPGQYYNPEYFTSFPAKKLPRKLQFFGSKSIRFRSGSVESTIGPGSYGVLRAPLAKKKPGNSRAPFASTKQRFEPAFNYYPGPGAYQAPGKSKQTWGKQGVFGTTEKRFVGEKPKDIPGPGYYPPDAHMRVGIHNSTKKKPMSVFCSNAKRDIAYGMSPAPAPGTYDIPSSIGVKKSVTSTQPLVIALDESMKKAVAFNSQADRFRTTSEPPAKVGPGAYNPTEVAKSQSHTSTGKVFVAKARRFQSQTQENPGPGAYYDDPADIWTKKSYNVLFSELAEMRPLE